MSRIIKGGLIQARNVVDAVDGATVQKIKDAMVEKHVKMTQEAAAKGVQVLCLQELFYGPYFCAEQKERWYDLTERIPDGPTTKLFCELAARHRMVIVLPIYEEEITGVYYNTAAVIDADGKYLGKYRKHHIPHCNPGFWEKFYFKPGNMGYPTFDTAVGRIGVYICYDRHFPEGARVLGLKGAEIVFNPSATVAGLSEYLWKLEQPAHAVANAYFVGAINRVGVEKPWSIGEFYGQSYFCNPRGQLIAEGPRDKDAVVTADLDLDMIREVRNVWQFYRDRRPETYEEIADLATVQPMAPDIFIVDGARTPFGAFGGTLKAMTATDMGVVAAKEALKRSHVQPDQVDHVVFGNVAQTAADAIYLARHVGLRSGVPVPVPALTVNRLCGSGFQAVVSGAQDILVGDSRLCLVGGAESMSQSPHVIRGARWGLGLGQGQLEDSLWQGLTDSYCSCPMAITAENLADQAGITREQADQWAYTSQMRTKAAAEAGRLAAEIVAVEVPGKKGPVTFDKDEHPRFDASLEKMARLPPVFKKGGVVTAGNASGISDGAGAMVIASAERVKELGLQPVGRLVAWASVGVPPDIMGIGPVESCRLALRKAGLKLEQMDLVEINEAFAAQMLACSKELGIDPDKLNVNGGAVALGHPLAASGVRLTLTILYELRRRKARYGLASACIGGGQGIALVVENVAA